METISQSNLTESRQASRTARLAASLFFFVCVPLSLWESNVHSRIFVLQNPVSTAHNLLANEFIFRMSIVSHLTGFLTFVFMVVLFYRIFRPVDKHLSRLMLFAVLAQVPAVFVFEVFNYTALMTLKSEARSTFDIAQQQEAAYFLLRMPRFATGAGMGKLFLGLCFIPFGMLVFRSGFAPRIIGILLIIGGVGYVADCCIAVLLQRVDYVMIRPYLMSTTLCYAIALLWFLIKGVRNSSSGVNY
ncbi:MAG TPA: DUF4386 domain-containing protein [Cyclobacteriaceae bacterium]|nr:DUF4386 domain-containing protein [Cyclobacteriaceae bacterium]